MTTTISTSTNTITGARVADLGADVSGSLVFMSQVR
jgi:hypothetical protein